jgi:hypothetical protein
MKQSDDQFRESKAIGNIAENIVEFIINSTPNWRCIKYGMENHIEELIKRLQSLPDHTNTTASLIRSMPDFIAINEKTNQVILIDCKYRGFIDRRKPKEALYSFPYSQIKTYLDYWPSAHLFIVHPYEPYFILVNLEDVEWHRHFHSRKEINGRLVEQWNFAGIYKNLKDVFQEVPENVLKQAISMIPTSHKKEVITNV